MVTLRPASRRPLVGLVLAAVALTGCSAGDADGPGSVGMATSGASATATPARVGSGGPLDGLPDCAPLEVEAVAAEVPGLVTPPGTTITSVDVDDPLTQVEAFVELDPVQVHDHYREESGLRSLVLEDETLEAEGLMQTPGHRFFFKAQAMCRTRSVMVFVIAPSDRGAGLPEPAGKPDPGT